MIRSSLNRAMKEALAATVKGEITYDVFGAGSNLIVKDGGFRGVLIDLSKHFDKLDQAGELGIRAAAGTPLPTVVARARDWGMGGAEKICGIPGQVGGAVAMNAGTKDGDTQCVIAEITIVDKNGKPKTLPREKIPFEYRSWGLDRGTVCVEALFAFEKADPKKLAKTIDDSKAKRKASQPLDVPNAGCAFKNVVDPKSGRTKLHAGKVIEELGLKGVRVRGARISPVHANFIVNEGNATARDVLAVLALVRDKVKEAHGIVLESEWRVMGEEKPDEEEDI